MTLRRCRYMSGKLVALLKRVGPSMGCLGSSLSSQPKPVATKNCESAEKSIVLDGPLWCVWRITDFPRISNSPHTGHLCDQLADFTGNPRAPTAPATACSISPKRRPAVSAPAQDRLRLDDDQAVAPLGPPAREQYPKQPIPKAKAGATSSAALQYGDLMAQRDPFQQQRGAGSGFASGDRDRPACRHRHEDRLSPDVRNHQLIRADYVLRSHNAQVSIFRLPNESRVHYC